MAPRRAAPVHNLASETLGQERTASGLRCASTFLLDQPFGCRRAIKWRLINLPKKIRDKNANYLFTHSLMFTVDWYTQTGINADVKLNDHRSIMAGIHAGDDVASWNRAAHPAAMLMVCWLSKSNNDTIYRDIDSLNGPPHSWFEGVGPGAPIVGNAPAVGVVAHFLVVGGYRLGDGAGSVSDHKKPASDFMAGADFSEGAECGWIEV
jgi:hypothetical protein